MIEIKAGAGRGGRDGDAPRQRSSPSAGPPRCRRRWCRASSRRRSRRRATWRPRSAARAPGRRRAARLAPPASRRSAARTLHVDQRRLDRADRPRSCATPGYPLLAYTVNGRSGREVLFAWGVDCGFHRLSRPCRRGPRRRSHLISLIRSIHIAWSDWRPARSEGKAGKRDRTQTADHFRPRGAAAGRGRQGHLGVERRELRRLGGLRRRRHLLRRQRRQLRRARPARSRRSITAARAASGTRS